MGILQCFGGCCVALLTYGLFCYKVASGHEMFTMAFSWNHTLIFEPKTRTTVQNESEVESGTLEKAGFADYDWRPCGAAHLRLCYVDPQQVRAAPEK